MPAPETPKCPHGGKRVCCVYCHDEKLAAPAPAVGVPDHEAATLLASYLDSIATEMAGDWEAGDVQAVKDSAQMLRALLSRSGETAPRTTYTTQKCPVCDGHGYLGYPKGVAPGQSFTDSSTSNYPCHACGGVGLLRESPSAALGSGETREAVWVALRNLAPHYSPKTQARLGALADACEGIGPMWPEEGSSPRPDDMRAAVRYLDDCLTLGHEERPIAMLLVHAGEQAILAGYALPAPRERHGRVSRVLCGNCGAHYNAPEQEDQHGVGKCGRVSELQDALKKYGRHLSPCHEARFGAARDEKPIPECSCGLTAALGAETP